jgi:hypothetical protein
MERLTTVSNGLGEEVNQTGIALDRGMIAHDLPRDSEVASRRDGVGTLLEMLHGMLALGIFGMPHIERDLHRAGNHIADARHDLECASRGEQARYGTGEQLGGKRQFGGGWQWVSPQVHGDRSSMTSFSGEGGEESGLAGNGRDDAQRSIDRFQERALFDMYFDVSEGLSWPQCSRCQALRFAAKRCNRFSKGDALTVWAIEKGTVKRSGQRRAAKVRCLESKALFIRKGDDLDGERQAFSPLGQSLDGGDGDQDAEWAIVLSGIAHAVEVAAH